MTAAALAHPKPSAVRQSTVRCATTPVWSVIWVPWSRIAASAILLYSATKIPLPIHVPVSRGTLMWVPKCVVFVLTILLDVILAFLRLFARVAMLVTISMRGRVSVLRVFW